jgi:hypothetical protein
MHGAKILKKESYLFLLSESVQQGQC